MLVSIDEPGNSRTFKLRRQTKKRRSRDPVRAFGSAVILKIEEACGKLKIKLGCRWWGDDAKLSIFTSKNTFCFTLSSMFE